MKYSVKKSDTLLQVFNRKSPKILREEIVRIDGKYQKLSNKRKSDLLLTLLDWTTQELKKIN